MNEALDLEAKRLLLDRFCKTCVWCSPVERPVWDMNGNPIRERIGYQCTYDYHRSRERTPYIAGKNVLKEVPPSGFCYQWKEK
jgi:hypothetical protein